MKFYGYLVGPFGPATDNGSFTIGDKGVKMVFTNQKARDNAAQAVAIKQFGSEPVFLFECTGIMEVQKPQFSKKTFTAAGELMPE